MRFVRAGEDAMDLAAWGFTELRTNSNWVKLVKVVNNGVDVAPTPASLEDKFNSVNVTKDWDEPIANIPSNASLLLFRFNTRKVVNEVDAAIAFALSLSRLLALRLRVINWVKFFELAIVLFLVYSIFSEEKAHPRENALFRRCRH